MTIVNQQAGRYEWTSIERQEDARRLSDMRAGMKTAARMFRSVIPIVWTPATAGAIFQQIDKLSGEIMATSIPDDE